MAAELGITPSAVSQHLKVLRYAGWLPYEIDHAAMAQCKQLISEVCNCGCRGTCRAQGSNPGETEDTLVSLKNRERELQEELRKVRARIRKGHEKV